MVNSQQISQKTLAALQKTGVIAQLVDPVATYAVSGSVTEGPLEYATWCSPLIDESKRWLQASITATIYASGYGLLVRPQPGWRVVHTGRTFVVIAAFPYSVHDTVIAWRLDVGEVASG